MTTEYKGMKVGFARVSTKKEDQDGSFDSQIKQLKEFGCLKIFHERISANAKKRPEFEKCITYLREGDTLVVVKLSRAFRSMSSMYKFIEDFQKRGIGFISINEPDINTSTATGRLMLNLMGTMAQFEVEQMGERCKEGVERGKLAGHYAGKRSKFTPEMIATIKEQHLSGVSMGKISKVYKCSQPHIYKIINGKIKNIKK